MRSGAVRAGAGVWLPAQEASRRTSAARRCKVVGAAGYFAAAMRVAAMRASP